MSFHKNLITLSEYNLWMNGTIYESAEKLSDEIRKKDMGAFFGSIHGTLNHILWADKNWLGRFVDSGYGSAILDRNIAFEEHSQSSNHRHEIHSDFSKLKSERKSLDEKLIRWVKEGLSEEIIRQNLGYKSLKGDSFSTPISEVLIHLFNHQTHHRGQVTTLLFQNGIDPGITDFIYFTRIKS
ncbi:DinB family protein [Leptospira inadai serovar Lyme str. 10]|uniref:DinB family protein n=2 Tax=Leptospira inadai serovar Lyme TaxID=293084 RepID=V6HPJ1_9LEPT|nr:DinB family protein [Leptospira inadai]EQA38785.1 DinB family protein [Leptospira inadai serovar Lyme str. 10]PNV74093.1 damage-inducible protein DinB [Leptospira inadai serovar Lyme]